MSVELLNPSLQAKLDSGLVRLCWVWEIVRTDGVTRRLCSHDVDVQSGGVTWQATASIQCSAIELLEGLEPTNMDIEGLLSDESISAADWLAGVYKRAQVRVGIADAADPIEPVLWIVSGMLGQLRRSRLTFKAQIYGIARLLERGSAELTSPTCRNHLGDTRCRVALAAYTTTGVVSAVTSRRVFVATLAAAQPNGWLTFGNLTWTSGANSGRAMEVKAQTAGAIELYLPMAGLVAVGDAFSVHAGCNLLQATCHSKFNNVIRFRGERDVPGTDRMTESNSRLT